MWTYVYLLYMRKCFACFGLGLRPLRQDPLFKSDLTLLTPTAATPLQIQHDPAMPKSHAEVHCEEMPHAT